MMSYLPSIKRARQYLLWIGGNYFFKNSAIKFATMCHFHSRRDISTIVTQNHVKLEHMETRHRDLSRDTKLKKSKLPKTSKQQHKKKWLKNGKNQKIK